MDEFRLLRQSDYWRYLPRSTQKKITRFLETDPARGSDSGAAGQTPDGPASGSCAKQR